MAGSYKRYLPFLAYIPAALAILWPLGLTNRILAGVDALTYFTPYWAYRMAEMRIGRLPLWNPYLFLGAPFLANPQTAVLYPLHWPLAWLDPSRALIWSAVLHVWLAAALMYAFARRSLALSQPAAWLAGLWFGLGGFTLARIENINQLNALAWLPALPWLLDETSNATGWRGRARWGSALSVVIAVQLLAGHTQTAFINMVAVGLYAAWKSTANLRRRSSIGPAGVSHSRRSLSIRDCCAFLGRWARMPAAPSLIFLAAALIPAVLLCAAQLIPSIELNTLGLRTGGLPYRLAVSFSLRPRLLAQTFLPPFGAGLAEAFASEGYAEFVGYVGLTGLLLALVGALSLRQTPPRSPGGEPASPAQHLYNRMEQRTVSRSALLLLLVAGIVLALGAYNPLYYLLWRFVPGFDLFRVPARWLALFSLGMAGLGGVGVERWFRRPVTADHEASPGDIQPASSVQKGCLAMAPRWAFVAGSIALLALTAYQQWPRLTAVAMWVLAGIAVVGLLWAARRWSGPARAGLIALTMAELILASRALPYALATAHDATGLRNAPAALLAAAGSSQPAGRDRFLSLSDIRFDPGDLKELRQLETDSLPLEAVERFVRAAKWMEVIAPNLSMQLKLPAVDGYDGGVLPLASYVKLESLFLPPGQSSPDGRLREQLREIPPRRLLDLTGTRFVITDKQTDLWAGDVYYDLEQAAVLKPGESLELNLAGYPAFQATGLGVISYLAQDAAHGTVVAEISVAGADGKMDTLPLRAGVETAPGQGPAAGITVARAWPDWMGTPGHDYLARMALDTPMAPSSISIRVLPASPGELVIRGLSLVDERTGAHSSVTVSQHGDFRRIHSGDVKIYERLNTPGRAWLVHGVRPAADDTAALAILADTAFDPRTTAIITGATREEPAGKAAPDESVQVLDYQPGRIVLRAQTSARALLVLADAYYPGWQATVDGQPAPILHADLMFRAVGLNTGAHDIIFTYQPAGWRWGAIVSMVTLGMMVIVVGASLKRQT